MYIISRSQVFRMRLRMLYENLTESPKLKSLLEFQEGLQQQRENFHTK